MKKHILLFGLSALLMSCGGSDGEESHENEEIETTDEVCTYSYDASSTVLTWTAFKLTEKVGVNGTFDEINVVANDGAEDQLSVLNGASFEIPINSLNSQDEVRDPKLKNSFFGNMVATEMITGTIVQMDEFNATVDITMNGMTVEYDGHVEMEEETITMSTTIDIMDFNGQVAMDSLSVVCAEKHTGEDGVNKFWNEVEIVVKTTLVKDCK